MTSGKSSTASLESKWPREGVQWDSGESGYSLRDPVLGITPTR